MRKLCVRASAKLIRYFVIAATIPLGGTVLINLSLRLKGNILPNRGPGDIFNVQHQGPDKVGSQKASDMVEQSVEGNTRCL